MALIAGGCGSDAGSWLDGLARRRHGAGPSREALGSAAFAGDTHASLALCRKDGLLIVADARIDDRAVLSRNLGLSVTGMSDAALIARAWRRWGERTADALLGDYAFAVFDARRETMWLVRDAIGFRPLCFAVRGSGGFFASRPSTLSGSGQTSPLTLDREPAARSTPLTWFSGVEQVQPGEAVALRAGAASRRFWWQPSTTPSFTGDRVDLLSEIGARLRAAVADRSGGGTGLATHLSAGLDSTAVTVTAADTVPAGATLLAISAGPAPGLELVRPPHRLVDETAHARDTAACHPAIRHSVVHAGQRSIAADVLAAAASFDQPLANLANYGWFAGSCAVARAAGATRLLIAQCGNFSISAEATGFWPLLLRREGAGRFLAEWHRAGFVRTAREFVRSLVSEHETMAQRRLAVLRSLDPGLFLKGFAQQGLEVLDPSADRRLIEFALSVPEHLWVRDGDRRWIVRQMLRGRVPDHVLDDPRRGLQAADWLARLSAEGEALIGLLDDAGARVGEGAGDGTGDGFDASKALLRRIMAGFDPALDVPAKTTLAADLAAAGFAIGLRRR